MRALKRNLVGFHNHNIYKVHIKKQNKVIKLKGLQIFEDITAKIYTFLSDFGKKPMFGGVQISDSKQDPPILRSLTSKEKINIKRRIRKATPPTKRQKLMLITVKQKQIRERQTVKPIPKAVGKIILPSQVDDPEVLITQLTQLFSEDWEEKKRISAFLIFIDQVNTTLNQPYIFANSLYKTNSIDPGDFVFST